MKCLVTGGNGFIGSHLVDRLIDDGNDVYVVDNLSGCNDCFYYNKNATYYKENIIDFSFEKIGKIDYVFHLAAESRIPLAIENPILASETNVLGTVHLLQQSRYYGVKRFLYSSTSSVYGLTNELPTSELCSIDCLNPYSVSKYSGEQFCKMYSSLYGLDTCIFRYFNVYGERSPIKGQYCPVIGLFLEQNKENMLHIMGDGSKRRDFIHVYDVISANILAMNYNSNINGEIFNVGSGKNYSILDIAKFINSNITFHEERPGEAKDTLADINNIRQKLDWKPTINLFEWLDKRK
jgi:UDP-glucose 4-epimerase